MTRRPRRAAAAAAIVLAVSGLSACGFDAQTDKILADNAQGSTPQGGIAARALVLVKSPNAIAAALAGTLINKGDSPDTLESITLTPDGVQGAGTQAITVQPNKVLEPHSVSQFGIPGHDPITIPNAQNLKLGHFVDVLLHFKTAGDIKVQVETHKREGFYSDVLPATTTTTQADARRARTKTNASTTRTTTGTATTGTATTGTATTGEAPTGGDGAVASKSSVTGAPTAKAATRAAERAAKRAAAKTARATEAAKTAKTAKAPKAAPMDPMAPMEPMAGMTDPAAAGAPHGGH